MTCSSQIVKYFSKFALENESRFAASVLERLNEYNIFRPNIRSKESTAMDMKAVGLRIKEAREAKKLTQEDLAAIVGLSPTHVSVIERGLKTVKLDKFVAIANALDVSANSLLVDVAVHSIDGAAGELSEAIKKLPVDERKRCLRAIKAYISD